MNELLQASAAAIANWLEAKLPALGANWWVAHVVERLAFHQQRLVETNQIRSLSRLDLAALLRVLDQNWSEIAGLEALPREGRSWVKELQSVRNRWAHAPVGGVSPSDAYRDADTLARLLAALKGSDDLLKRIEEFKSKTLREIALSQSAGAESLNERAEASEVAPEVRQGAPGSKFTVGQIVCLRSNPAAVFPVLEVLRPGNVETRYRVFENGARQVYYESQLKELEEASESYDVLTAAELSAFLTAVFISSPSTSALYSLNSGRVRFVPYQYRPVFKLIRADQPRLLIADEVGVGKTIESGLILKELQARDDIKSVLIICPKALVSERKWELEMKRFDEHFVPLDGALLRHCIRETQLDGEWPIQYEKVILPTSLFDSELLFGKTGKGKSKEPGLLELDPPPRFDLVIVDEAHHLRNSDTFLHQAVRYFVDNAGAALFLSATPVQLGREDLYTLLNALRPDVIIDQASFNQMAEPNQFVNEAIQACRRGHPEWAEEVRRQLRNVAATAWGRGVLSTNPGFQHIYDQLAEGPEEATSRIKTIYALEELYTFSSLINRTRRRDIGAFTTRKAETVVTDYTPSQKSVHDDLLAVIARILTHLHGNSNVKFMMTTISRQAASSLYGLAPALQDILRGNLARLEEEWLSDAGEPSVDFVEQVRGDIESLIERAKKLDPEDPKAKAFMQLISQKLGMPRNKVLVFSTFRHTLRYLASKLDNAQIRFGLVHGDIPDEERATLRKRFSLPREDNDALDVLLSSEVGCEGLDFQFCDCLVNFDLPWNPMRIEQRIGRIDRYGQQSETVGIFNLITTGTIDAEIYDRCLTRIGVFQHAIGGNEEILGDINRELQSIGETFSLSDDERRQRLQQLADNKIRQMEEEQRLEERQGELFGLNLEASSWEQRIADSRSCWLEPQALALAVSTYLAQRLDKSQDYLLGDKPLKTLRLSQEARAELLADYRKLGRTTDPVYRSWEKWLRGTTPTLPVTFEQEAAVESPGAVLISLAHPLVRQAAAYLFRDEPLAVKLSIIHDSLPLGEHPFALYRWAKQGVKRDETLIPVARNQELAGVLLDVLSSAVDAPALEVPSQQTWDELDSVHHQLWLAESTQHAEDNRQLVGVRIQSLTASFAARRALIQGQISAATNDKIVLMRRAELQRAQVDFEARIASLRQAAESGDIRATPAVFGVMEVRRSA